MSTQEDLIYIVFDRLSGVYGDPSRVMRDAEGLLFSSHLGSQLNPRAEQFMLNDVLMLEGTLPMTYRDVTYHIPIDMYLPPQYPAHPPIVFVRPAATMSIKAKHKHVGQDGMVNIPYLHSWKSDTCDLTDLAVFMSSMFGDEPPCYAEDRTETIEEARLIEIEREREVAEANLAVEAARRAEEQETADRTETIEEARLIEIEREVAEANLAVEAARRAEEQETAEAKRRAEAEKRARLAEERRRRIEQEAADAAAETERVRLAEEARLRRERADAIAVATSAARSAMKDLFDRARGELRVELRDQKQLEAGRDSINALLREGEERKARLVCESEQLDESIRALDRWLRACENGDEGSGVNADLLAIPADTQSAQMLTLSSESAAVDDCVYFLDMALARGKLTSEVFLKEVRRLSKRQFLAKAHLIKIEKMRATEHR